jgi:hypothetical protein
MSKLGGMVKGRIWLARRLGLSPGKLWTRLANRTEPRIVCICIPKAGTHLLERALCLHPRLYRKLLPTLGPRNIRRRGGLAGVARQLRPGQIVMTHMPFDAEYPAALARCGVKTVFLIRDPRDVAVSQAHFVSSKEDHWLHQTFASRSNFNERLRLTIDGDEEAGLLPASERLDASAGWLDAADVVIRFEDLIGRAAGGRDERQLETLRALYRGLGLPTDDVFLASLAGKLFSSNSPTFRRGAIGQWRKEFDAETLKLFKTAVGVQIDRYGYGGDW